MDGRRPLLDPPYVEPPVPEVDLVPAQVHELADPQPVAISYEDHGGVAVSPAVVPGRPDQAIDLGLGQVFPRPIGGVRLPAGPHCSNNGGWDDDFQARFCHCFQYLGPVNCLNSNPSLNS